MTTASVLTTDLFEMHAPRLVGALTAYTGNSAEAEDLAQEAFARVYAATGRIREPHRATSYLYSTAFNLARSQWRRRATLERALRRIGAADSSPPVEAGVLQRAGAAATTAAVAALPGRQRACVILRYYGDLPVADVAAVLCISSNSVKTHLRRGLATLRISLGGEAYDAQLSLVD